MKVKFLEFYQGVKTYPHSYQPGEMADVSDEDGAELIALGRAEEVKPERKTASKRTAKKGSADNEA